MAKSGDTETWLLPTFAELDAEGVVNRSVELSDELKLESPEEEEEESDDVEMYAVALLTSTPAVLL